MWTDEVFMMVVGIEKYKGKFRITDSEKLLLKSWDPGNGDRLVPKSEVRQRNTFVHLFLCVYFIYYIFYDTTFM